MRRTDIAEITTGNDDIEAQVSLACLKANAQPRRNVIHNLCQQTGPIDGVNRTDMPLLFEVGIDVDGFNKILTVIKDAVDCDIDDVVVKEGEHLCALEGSHASGGGEHDDAEPYAASERVFRSASGVTRRCANNGQPITASSQLVFEELTKKLHCHVFKCSRRTIRQVGKPKVFFCIHTRNRDNFGVRKYGGTVCASADTFKILTRNVIDEERQYLSSKSGVAVLSKHILPTIQLLSAELRVCFGQVEPTVRRKTCEQNIAEGGGSGLGISGRNVTHVLTLP